MTDVDAGQHRNGGHDQQADNEQYFPFLLQAK
jgi:hypothetical protein